MDDFHRRCIEANVLIVPVVAYSAWGADGNVHEDARIGIRYYALGPYYSDCVGPDFRVQVDLESSEPELMKESPEAALEAYLAARNRPSSGV